MSPAYVPPGRRSQSEALASPTKKYDDNLRSLRDIRAFFWPMQDETGDTSTPSAASHQGSLQDSKTTPGQLAYIVLFDGANPRWEKEQIVFAKTNLHLLTTKTNVPVVVSQDQEEASSPKQAQPIDPKTTAITSQPIAIFKQQPKTSQTGRSFAFQGWYTLYKLDFLEPQSQELIRMLEQKWTTIDKYGKVEQKPRSPAHWKQALEQKWAVIKLSKLQGAGEAPAIQQLPDRKADVPSKSVNEMLAEMRLSGKQDDGEAPK